MIGVLTRSSQQPGGPVAETIQDLWWFLLALSAVVFLLFLVLLVRGLVRRKGPEQQPDERQLTRRWVLVGGALMPLGVLTAVMGGTVYAMRATPVPGSKEDALAIDIVGHQWRYEVSYPDQGVRVTDELHLPVGRYVELRLTSADVIHSFWVPELAGKLDMLPDYTNRLVLHADRPGQYVARCAEFCGHNHAHMHMPVIAEPVEDFDAWLAARR